MSLFSLKGGDLLPPYHRRQSQHSLTKMTLSMQYARFSREGEDTEGSHQGYTGITAPFSTNARAIQPLIFVRKRREE
jgi:hypothetical protein